MANLSYQKIMETGRCTDYGLYYAGNFALWTETWLVGTTEYRALFSTRDNTFLPLTITKNEITPRPNHS